ncbi:hypothetical protein B0H17DRAFT_1211356 [Mycena rosella]|uniref:Uncharacterized protein n=1 Tax=Mycena rosella TaxID=1033263 RepID=A0AAD7G6F9_MYCRO|nr:hypothetical protein B0H17DRAFT_1211356 [Mycena rosella]
MSKPLASSSRLPQSIPLAIFPNQSRHSTPAATVSPPSVPIDNPTKVKRTTLPAPIPKAITDRLLDQSARIEELEKNLEQEVTLVATLRKAQSSLQAEFDDLDNEHSLTVKRLQTVEEANPELAQKSEPESKPKKRDNAFNNAVRKTFYIAMGLPKASKLKDAANVKPKKVGGCYIVDHETGGRILRPDWTASFTENSVWHVPMIKFMRQKIPSDNPMITAAIMQAKADDDILERVEVVFKNISTEARKLPVSTGSTDGSDDDSERQNDAGENQDENQNNRRKGRKVRKCDERINALAKYGKVLAPKFRFLLQAPYQSTDESDHSDVLDPDTDTEKNDELQNAVISTDELVMQSRDDYERNNKGKTAAHPRVRAGKPKISRDLIQPGWLAANPDDDTPSRIEAEEHDEAMADTHCREDEEVTDD